MKHLLRLADSDSARYTGASMVSGWQGHEDPNTPVNVTNYMLITGVE